ncbi:hypothetical protein LZ31DRAFT_483608 [Colletotrichum somersetense]|nr:hypothetical protein LZ31DRAFT_483608 [Colletotrichum somersetense]
MLSRKLRPIHLFMISLNGVLGTGLYGRSGQILELGGPLAVFVSYSLVGLVAFAVMKCLTELLCVWPVPGALSLFVRTFLDNELGIAVGIAYWFAFSIGFSALIASAASYLDFWTEDVPAVTLVVIYIILPAILVGVNTVEVEMYGWIEVITGCLKIAFFGIIFVTLIVIHSTNWEDPLPYDPDAAKRWTESLFMSISIASFAYVGVEIIAVSAVEAKWSKTHADSETLPRSQQEDGISIASTIKFTANYIPIIIPVGYAVAGLLVSINFKRDDCRLPRLSWLQQPGCDRPENSTTSPFIIITEGAPIGHVFNGFILFTVLSCANTNLYVASRTLFGLTHNLPGNGWIVRWLAWFGETDSRRVPLRAMAFSALAFFWVPFLQYPRSFDAGTKVGMFIEILSQIGSIGTIIVWACVCGAYIRYYNCLQVHGEILKQEGILLKETYIPHRSHWQPILAWLGLAGCVILLLVCNGAFLWHRFHFFPFLSAYLPILVFLVLWVVLKIFSAGNWSGAPLTEQDTTMQLRILNELRQGTSWYQLAE